MLVKASTLGRIKLSNFLDQFGRLCGSQPPPTKFSMFFNEANNHPVGLHSPEGGKDEQVVLPNPERWLGNFSHASFRALSFSSLV